MKTQLEKVSNHLKKKKSITSWEAIQKYHITRLSQYILCLRKEGLKIESKWVNPLKGNRYVKYILKK